MPREIVTLQVGQCGNQLGRAFWHRSLHEHAANATTSSFPGPGGSSRTASQFSESMSTFFSNSNPPPSGKPLPPGSEILDLKARACLIDTEDGVVSETLRGPLRDLFASRQTLHDVSGAGNNWAHGYHGYGDRYEEAIAELVRSQAEPCDSLQSFFLMHSLGGGTGSGLGTRVLQLLADEYRGVYRFATSVLPSKDGKGGDSDVVVAPYNTVGARRAPPRENPDRFTPDTPDNAARTNLRPRKYPLLSPWFSGPAFCGRLRRLPLPRPPSKIKSPAGQTFHSTPADPPTRTRMIPPAGVSLMTHTPPPPPPPLHVFLHDVYPSPSTHPVVFVPDLHLHHGAVDTDFSNFREKHVCFTWFQTDRIVMCSS
jgi:hypothetical protein